MSHHDYIQGREIEMQGRSFYALIQSAMRQADSVNLAKLVKAFPDVWAELQARYHAPGGKLEVEL